MDTINGFPVLTVEYGKSGKAKNGAQARHVQKFVSDEGIEELLVISHGWNNSASEARDLYVRLLRHIRDILSVEPALAARKIGVLAVIWPSKRFKAFELNPEIVARDRTERARVWCDPDDVVVLNG